MRLYRNFIEPAVAVKSDSDDVKTQKYFSGKIVTVESSVDGKYRVFTDEIKAELFDNRPFSEKLITVISSQIKFFLKKYRVSSSDLVLVGGIGNENLTADKLGCTVIDKLYATAHIYKDKRFHETIGNLASVKCGVSGVTGIESYLHLSALCNALRPKIIIVVDTLAANRLERLGSSVQLSDVGITPGKGVGNAKKEFSSASLSVPVIAIGVPLVISAEKIVAAYLDKNDFVTAEKTNLTDLAVMAKDVDFLVKDFSGVIAESINRAVHDYEE